MADRIKMVVHKGQKIMVLDASGLKPNEIIALFPEYQQMGITNRVRLYALDITNTHSNNDIKNASKASIDAIQSKLGKTYTALVGVTGIQKIIASAVDPETYFAASMDDAFNWLAARTLE